jgi:serine/threonine protein kinase
MEAFSMSNPTNSAPSTSRAHEPDSPPTNPRRVGEFEIVREIARGGMAIVYLAHQPALGRDVALKELMRFPGDDGSLAQRFLQESKVAGSLAHPSIVSVYNYFETDGVPYIAMEHLERGSLREYIGELSLSQIAGVLEGVLAGLAYAELKGIVHRDLKPENLLVSANGTIEIADFGIAKALKQVSQHLTKTGMTMGTPAYMAPEQAMGQEVGPTADLYSVGAIAHELLLGVTPFEDDHTDEPWALLMKLVNEPLRPPLERDPDLDPGLAAWLERMLAKSPHERPARASDAWDELEDVIVDRLGAVWRRDARLPERGADPQTEKPLSEAEFPSVSLPTPVPRADGYVTYPHGPATPPVSANGDAPVIPPGPTAPVARPPSPMPSVPDATTPTRDDAADFGRAVTRPPAMPIDEAPAVTTGDAVAPTPRRRWRRFAVAAVAVAALGGAGVTAMQVVGSSPPALDLAPVEQQIRARLAPANEVERITCPPGMVSQVHQTFDCTAALAGGGSMDVSVTQRDAAGHVDVEPHL